MKIKIFLSKDLFISIIKKVANTDTEYHSTNVKANF